MSVVLKSVIAAAAALTLFSGAASATSCALPKASDLSRAADTVTAVRRAAGMGGVAVDPTLARVATAQACAMAASGKMVHSGGGRGPGRALRQAGYDWVTVAENIAAGPMNLDQTMGAWQASPGHRANLLLRGAQAVGIGEATAADGRTRFWALVIAAPR